MESKTKKITSKTTKKNASKKAEETDPKDSEMKNKNSENKTEKTTAKSTKSKTTRKSLDGDKKKTKKTTKSHEKKQSKKKDSSSSSEDDLLNEAEQAVLTAAAKTKIKESTKLNKENESDNSEKHTPSKSTSKKQKPSTPSAGEKSTNSVKNYDSNDLGFPVGTFSDSRLESNGKASYIQSRSPNYNPEIKSQSKDESGNVTASPKPSFSSVAPILNNYYQYSTTTSDSPKEIKEEQPIQVNLFKMSSQVPKSSDAAETIKKEIEILTESSDVFEDTNNNKVDSKNAKSSDNTEEKTKKPVKKAKKAKKSKASVKRKSLQPTENIKQDAEVFEKVQKDYPKSDGENDETPDPTPKKKTSKKEKASSSKKSTSSSKKEEKSKKEEIATTKKEENVTPKKEEKLQKEEKSSKKEEKPKKEEKVSSAKKESSKKKEKEEKTPKEEKAVKDENKEEKKVSSTKKSTPKKKRSKHEDVTPKKESSSSDDEQEVKEEVKQVVESPIVPPPEKESSSSKPVEEKIEEIVIEEEPQIINNPPVVEEAPKKESSSSEVEQVEQVEQFNNNKQEEDVEVPKEEEIKKESSSSTDVLQSPPYETKKIAELSIEQITSESSSSPIIQDKPAEPLIEQVAPQNSSSSEQVEETPVIAEEEVKEETPKKEEIEQEEIPKKEEVNDEIKQPEPEVKAEEEPKVELIIDEQHEQVRVEEVKRSASSSSLKHHRRKHSSVSSDSSRRRHHRHKRHNSQIMQPFAKTRDINGDNTAATPKPQKGETFKGFLNIDIRDVKVAENNGAFVLHINSDDEHPEKTQAEALPPKKQQQNDEKHPEFLNIDITDVKVKETNGAYYLTVNSDVEAAAQQQNAAAREVIVVHTDSSSPPPPIPKRVSKYKRESYDSVKVVPHKRVDYDDDDSGYNNETSDDIESLHSDKLNEDLNKSIEVHNEFLNKFMKPQETKKENQEPIHYENLPLHKRFHYIPTARVLKHGNFVTDKHDTVEPLKQKSRFIDYDSDNNNNKSIEDESKTSYDTDSKQIILLPHVQLTPVKKEWHPHDPNTVSRDVKKHPPKQMSVFKNKFIEVGDDSELSDNPLDLSFMTNSEKEEYHEEKRVVPRSVGKSERHRSKFLVRSESDDSDYEKPINVDKINFIHNKISPKPKKTEDSDKEMPLESRGRIAMLKQRLDWGKNPPVQYRK